MVSNTHGIFGSNISYSRAIISSLPVIGTVMSFANDPRVYYLTNKEYLNIRLPHNERADARDIKDLNKLIIYGACAAISHCLTFVITIILIILHSSIILNFPWIVCGLGGISGGLSVINGYVQSSRMQRLEFLLTGVIRFY